TTEKDFYGMCYLSREVCVVFARDGISHSAKGSTRKTNLALEDSEHRLQDHPITELAMLTLDKNPVEAK
ncbi:hypothetical protein, partial [Alicyclobacillus mali (ex Roth et al. 2021)]|uniref:hypothetical protein n=1 Tax=Alicyclobacillus mali (ex Roth et al. 2021) TaxID=1123961 RepID=UPI001A8D1DFB